MLPLSCAQSQQQGRSQHPQQNRNHHPTGIGVHLILYNWYQPNISAMWVYFVTEVSWNIKENVSHHFSKELVLGYLHKELIRYGTLYPIKEIDCTFDTLPGRQWHRWLPAVLGHRASSQSEAHVVSQATPLRLRGVACETKAHASTCQSSSDGNPANVVPCYNFPDTLSLIALPVQRGHAFLHWPWLSVWTQPSLKLSRPSGSWGNEQILQEESSG